MPTGSDISPFVDPPGGLRLGFVLRLVPWRPVLVDPFVNAVSAVRGLLASGVEEAAALAAGALPSDARLEAAVRKAAGAKAEAREAKAALKHAKKTFRLARKAAKAARRELEALRAAIAGTEEAPAAAAVTTKAVRRPRRAASKTIPDAAVADVEPLATPVVTRDHE